MDFHSLPRRDLQLLCKRNKIPANMTNVAMADALKALEIVEGLDEYMNESDSNAPQCPTTVAKQPPKTATRTTRRKTTTKAESQPPSKLVTSSCQLKSKSLAGEMEQESKTNKVAKTPAARSTRKASAATSCIIKVQESKKDESVYNTRRSTRGLGKSMANLSLETKETLDKPDKDEDTEQKVSPQENSPAAGSEEGSDEDEVIPGRDLSASMEKEWEKMSKNDSDHEVGDLGNVAVLDANTETNIEALDEVMGDEKESMNSLVQVDKQEETSEANKNMCEEDPEKKDNDQETGDLGDISVLDYANTETNNDKKEPNNVPLAFEQQETEEGIQENDSEPEKINTFGEDTMVDQTGTDAHSETEFEKINTFVEDTMVDQPSGDATELEKINTFDKDTMVEQTSGDTHSETELEKINTFGEDTMVDQTVSDDSETEPEKIYVDLGKVVPVLDYANTDDQKGMQTETEEAIQEIDSEPEKINTFGEDTKMDQTGGDAHSETEFEKDTTVDQTGTDAHLETEFEKINTFVEDTMVDQPSGDAHSETEFEKINTFVEDTMVDQTSGDVHSETELEKINTFDEDAMVDHTVSDDASDSETEPEKIRVLDYANTETTNDQKEPKNVLALEQVEQQETEEAIQDKINTFDEDTTMVQTGGDAHSETEPEKINTFGEDAKMDQTDSDDSETEPEEDNSGVDADGTISEADSNQAVLGSDIAEEEMIVSEPESSLPLLLEEVDEVKTTPLSPLASESTAVRFPRPNKSTTPSKNSALKLVNDENTDKENNMVMMMNVDNGETKKKKKVAIDEESLKDASLRQLVKMLKEFSIKSSNRTALQILPSNNQMAE